MILHCVSAAVGNIHASFPDSRLESTTFHVTSLSARGGFRWRRRYRMYPRKFLNRGFEPALPTSIKVWMQWRLSNTCQCRKRPRQHLDNITQYSSVTVDTFDTDGFSCLTMLKVPTQISKSENQTINHDSWITPENIRTLLDHVEIFD